MKTGPLFSTVLLKHPRPKSDAWEFRSAWSDGQGPPVGAIYVRSGVTVISTRVVAKYPTGVGIGPQDHVSVSRRLRRAPASDVLRALVAFGMVGAEEDNHHPGIARHFWRSVDPAHRVECECKSTEGLVRDPDGYEWTTPTADSGEACRGCWYASTLGKYTGRSSCPIHGTPQRVASGRTVQLRRRDLLARLPG